MKYETTDKLWFVPSPPFGMSVPVANIVVYVVVSRSPPEAVKVAVTVDVTNNVVVRNSVVDLTETAVPLATLSLVIGKNG